MTSPASKPGRRERTAAAGPVATADVTCKAPWRASSAGWLTRRCRSGAKPDSMRRAAASSSGSLSRARPCTRRRAAPWCRRARSMSSRMRRLLGWRPEGEAIALKAAHRLIDRYHGADGGHGWVFSVHPDGAVHDARRDFYAHSFALFGLAWAYKLAPEPRFLSAALATLERSRPALRVADRRLSQRAARRPGDNASRTRTCICSRPCSRGSKRRGAKCSSPAPPNSTA